VLIHDIIDIFTAVYALRDSAWANIEVWRDKVDDQVTDICTDIFSSKYCFSRPLEDPVKQEVEAQPYIAVKRQVIPESSNWRKKAITLSGLKLEEIAELANNGRERPMVTAEQVSCWSNEIIEEDDNYDHGMVYFLAKITDCLCGGLNPEGVRKWLKTPRRWNLLKNNQWSTVVEEAERYKEK